MPAVFSQSNRRPLSQLWTAGATLAVMVLAIAWAPEAIAGGGVRVITNDGHEAKPSRYSSRWQGLFDATSYNASRLRWKRWGSKRTTGRGKMKQCIIVEGGGRDCRRFSGSVVQFRGRIDTSPCADLPYRLYREVRFRSYKGAWTDWLLAYRC